MIFLAQRLPPREQVLAVFLAVLFPVHFWAWVVFLRELPSYMLRMKVWDILGVLSYILVVALLDSLLIMAAILVLTLILPRRWLHDRFPMTAALLGYGFVLAVMPLHVKDPTPDWLTWIHLPWFFWLWIPLLLIVLVFLSFQILRSRRLEALFSTFIEKIGLVSSVYLSLSLCGLIILVFRNLSRG
jgi:hypothetical protein